MADPYAQMMALLREDVLVAAPQLLGWTLRRGELSARIVEVEAYRTPDDPGCHAHRGRTPRCESMFAEPGTAYVYFTYGNHWMLNVVAHERDTAAAILVRAAEPLSGDATFADRRPKARRPEDWLSGPGKLTAAFGITGADDGQFLLPGVDLSLEPGEPPEQIVVGTRIGLSLGKGDDLLWRFADASRLRWVSRGVASMRPLV